MEGSWLRALAAEQVNTHIQLQSVETLMEDGWGDEVRARKWDVAPSPGKEVESLIHLSTFTLEDRYYSFFLEIVL